MLRDPTRSALSTTRYRLRWWREVLYVLGFYGVYSLVRNQFGSASTGTLHAFNNAKLVIAVERGVGLYLEAGLQDVFLGAAWFLRFWNIYYGTFHFVVTIGALVWMYRRRPHRYNAWRNTLGFTTALALIGFSLFPLMPPRLLNAGPPYGGEAHASEDYSFVDTLDAYGGFLSFNDEGVAKVSNQYAAMPSLHCAWALWCTFVLWPLARRRWARALTVLYPVATVFAVVVTANHYWLDAIGGYVVLGVGYLLGRRLASWTHDRHALPSMA